MTVECSANSPNDSSDDILNLKFIKFIDQINQQED